MNNDKELEGKSFFQKWKIGLKRIDVVQLLDAKSWNHFGALAGIILITVTFAVNISLESFFSSSNLRTVGFTIFMIFLAGLQVVEILSNNRKKREIEQELKMYRRR